MSTVTQHAIAGLSIERLRRIDQLLQQRYIDPGKIAGALTLVARRGEIAHFSALGAMDAERGKPMRQDTIFRIYSMSKPITSVALMMLYEEGLWCLRSRSALPKCFDRRSLQAEARRCGSIGGSF